MKKKYILTIFILFIYSYINSQVIVVPTGLITASIVPEHGFLPGRKFKFYPTINTYNLAGKGFRIELLDERNVLKLKKVGCSEIEFTNTSEFSTPSAIEKVKEYIDTLFTKSGAIIDSLALDTLVIELEGLDVRLIGTGYARVHGLCQMRTRYKGISRTYCIDITDADENSPISSNSLVTRLTATRIMASVSIREIIEQIIADLQVKNKTFGCL